MRTILLIVLLLIILSVAGFIVYSNNAKIDALRAKNAADAAAQGGLWNELQNAAAYADSTGEPCNPFAPWNQTDASRGCYGKEQFNLGRYLNAAFGI